MSCTVCDHPQRAAIDAHLAHATLSKRLIASQFGLIETSIRRHGANHLPKTLVKAVARAENKEADAFLDFLTGTMSAGSVARDRGMSALATAELDPETVARLAPAYVSAGLRAAELLGNATGRLNQPQGATGATNVYLSVVLPRGDQLEQPAIEVQALPAADPDTLPE